MSRTRRPSELEWLTAIPADWDEREIGRDVWVRARLGWKGLTAEEYVDAGVPMLATPDIKDPEIQFAQAKKIPVERHTESPEIMLKVGDVLLTKDGSTIGTVNIVRNLPEPTTVNGSIAVLTPTTGLDGRYLYWFIASSYAQSIFGRLRGGMGVPHLFQRDINRIRMPHPGPAEQRAIADFLDHETARIDTLIEEQQRLIAMLRERRASVVERSIALLDWTTPFKAVSVLVQTGPFGSQLKSDEYRDGGTPIINPSHMIAGEVVPDPRVAVAADKASELARHALKEGDLICARRGDLGRCAVIGLSAVGYLCGTGSALVRLDLARIEPSYAGVVFGSRRNRDALALASVGSTMANLNSDVIGALRIPVPPLDEQRRIVQHVDEQTKKIDNLIAETERFIELSRERRAALITAAVTGQIDVREVA